MQSVVRNRRALLEGREVKSGAEGIGAAASAAIQANVMPSTADADFGAVFPAPQGGSSTWPIVAISYIICGRIRQLLAKRPAC